jgi:hypothetical protein
MGFAMIANNLDAWEINSNAGLQTIFTFVGLFAGLLLAVLGYKAGSFADKGSASALLLGIFIVLIAIVNLVINNQRSIRIEPNRRRILITDKSRFKQKQQVIIFGQIKDVYLTELGDKEGGSISYDVELKLRNGQTVSLFKAAFFDGTYNKSVMENHCLCFRQMLNN